MSLPPPTIEPSGRLVIRIKGGAYYIGRDGRVMRETVRARLVRRKQQPAKRVVSYPVTGRLADRIRAALVTTRNACNDLVPL